MTEALKPMSHSRSQAEVNAQFAVANAGLTPRESIKAHMRRSTLSGFRGRLVGAGLGVTAVFGTGSVLAQTEPSPAPIVSFNPDGSVLPTEDPITGRVNPTCPPGTVLRETPSPEPSESIIPDRTLPPDIGLIPNGEVLFAQGQNSNGETVVLTLAQEAPSAAPSVAPIEGIDVNGDGVVDERDDMNGDGVIDEKDTQTAAIDCIVDPEASKDKVQKALDAWITPNDEGQYTKVPIAEKFTYATHYTILNQLNINHHNFKYEVWYAAKILSSEVVDDHLVVYFGMEDWIGKQFFIPVNAGRISNSKIWYHWPVNSDFPFNMDATEISSNQMRRFVKKDEGNVVAFSVLGSKLDLKDRKYDQLENELSAQLTLAKDLVAMTSRITDRRMSLEEALAEAPDDIKTLINQRIKSGELDVSKLPLSIGILSKKSGK